MVDDYVLVQGVGQEISHLKPASICTAPWRISDDNIERIYMAHYIITGETRCIHIIRMWFYPDLALEVTKPVRQ